MLITTTVHSFLVEDLYSLAENKEDEDVASQIEARKLNKKNDYEHLVLSASPETIC